MSELKLLPSEWLGTDDCYVVSSHILSFGIAEQTYWISKRSGLVLKVLRRFGDDSASRPTSQRSVTRPRMAGATGGVFIEKYKNFRIDEDLEPPAFKYDLPKNATRKEMRHR